MTNRGQFEISLNDLRLDLVSMGNAVEDVVGLATKSLENADLETAKRIILSDFQINKMEEEIGEKGTTLIATQQPVAKDLRRILIAFKMASDLERMGDLAADIAKVTIRLEKQKRIKPLIDLPKMAEISRIMIKQSIEAFVEENVDLAYKMAKMDDEVDQLHGQVIRELFERVAIDPQHTNQSLQLAFVSRYLERIADYATNIGENVVFLVKGTWHDLNP